MKICLDAGHYAKYNQSPANSKYYESERMWALTMFQKKHLEQYGIEVVLTRTDINKDMPVYDRGAASKCCDLFISNHSNAVGSGVNESIDYPVSYVPISKKGDVIGQKLADCVAAVMGTTQKGRIEANQGSNGDYYGVLRGATAVGVVGVLIEHSFHTNAKATNWLMDDANLDKLAKAEADVIAEYLGVTKPTASATQLLNETAEAIDFLTSEGMITVPAVWRKNAVETGDFTVRGADAAAFLRKIARWAKSKN